MNRAGIRRAMSALALALMAGAARSDVMYWMIDGEASKSLRSAYAQTLAQAEEQRGTADNVVARAYVEDKSTGTRTAYGLVGVTAADKAGTSFDGAPVPLSLVDFAASDDWVFGVEMGIVDGDGDFTATYWAWNAEGLTFAQLDAMGAIQSDATSTYDAAVNAAGAVWTGATPEPSGALLLLLGTVCLMLRRGRHAA